jgi:hypothetical protein
MAWYNYPVAIPPGLAPQPRPLNDKLTSQQIQLPTGVSSIKLKFHHTYSLTYPASLVCTININLITNGKTINLQTYIRPPFRSTPWIQEVFDLTRYAGQVVQIQFYFISSAPTLDRWAIDDIFIHAYT